MESYHGAVREKVRSLTERKKLPEDVTNFTFVGKHSHDATLNQLLGFLEFIILSSEERVSLGTDSIDRLWQLFVQQPNFNSDQTLFLKWVNKYREVAVSYHEKKEIYLFNDQERKHFFTKILCNPTYVDFQRISIGQVKSFHKFFKVINREEGFIEQHPGSKKLLVKSYERLIGLETLKHIAVESENERSREDSMDLVVDLLLKMDHQTLPLEDQHKVWGQFIDESMASLDSPNEVLVSNTLQLLSKFLDRYEGKKTLKPEQKQTGYGNYQPLTPAVIFRPDNIKK